MRKRPQLWSTNGDRVLALEDVQIRWGMSNTTTGTRIGLISDAHGLLRPEALMALRRAVHKSGQCRSEEIQAARVRGPSVYQWLTGESG